MEFVVDRIVRGFCWVFAFGAMAAGMAFILAKTVPRITNKASRLVVSFVMGVPFGIVYGCSKVWLLGHTSMSWAEAFKLALPGALLFAILLTFWPPRSQNSNTE
jgi:hypothetical protein